MRESFKYHKNLIENFPVAVFIVDGNFKILLSSKKARELFDISASTAIETLNFSDLIQKESLSKCKNYFKNSDRKSDSNSLEINLLKKDKISFYASLNISNFDLSGDGDNTYIITIDDLSERIALVENLQKTIDDKDKLLSMISHDLINPITGIIGFSDLIIKEFKNIPDYLKKDLSESKLSKIEIKFYDSFERISQRANLINTSTKEVYSLLDNILEWTRINKNKIVTYLEPINVYELVQDVVSYSMSSFVTKNITVENYINENSHIVTDKNMMKTIIRNFLSNAIKFTPKGGEIEITSSKTLQGFIKISVSDNGVGIPDKHLKQILLPESNIATKGTESEKGTGLGLKLCKEFAERLNGTITIKSKRGKGTIVTLVLPTIAEGPFKD